MGLILHLLTSIPASHGGLKGANYRSHGAGWPVPSIVRSNLSRLKDRCLSQDVSGVSVKGIECCKEPEVPVTVIGEAPGAVSDVISPARQQPARLSLRTLDDPRSGSKVSEAPDREIGKRRENRGHIGADWQFQPAAAFHDRENGRNLWPRLGAADVYPVLPAQEPRDAWSFPQGYCLAQVPNIPGIA